jgi:predicted transcriptional regulator
MSVVKLHLIEEGPRPEPSVKKAKAPRVTAKRPSKDEAMPSKTPRKAAVKATEKTLPKTTNKPLPKVAPKTKKRDAMVSDVMQSTVITCGPFASLNDAARLMWEHDLGALVVVDEQCKPVSMITDRDICMAAYTQGVALMHGHVASAMAKKLLTVSVDASIDELTQLMAQAQVRRMPVVDERGKLVGLVGMADLMKETHGAKMTGRKRVSTGAMMAELLGEMLAS